MPNKKGKTTPWPCGQCRKSCKTDCVSCTKCDVWYHAACETLSSKQMSALSDKSIYFVCSSCSGTVEGKFDVDAALKRLFSSAQKSPSEFYSAATSEEIAARHLDMPSSDSDFMCGLPTDYTAMQILKLVRSTQNRRAVCVPGDGNCLFSAVSVALTGHTEAANELRLRAAIELGINAAYHKRVMSQKRYDIVSQNYMGACKSTAKNHAYSDAWTIQALASAIGRNIRCIYPFVNGQFDETAAILNSTFFPKKQLYRQPICIMWSSTVEPTDGKTWLPNHFVPMLDVVESVIDITLSPKHSPAEWPELSRQNLCFNRRLKSKDFAGRCVMLEMLLSNINVHVLHVTNNCYDVNNIV